MAAPAESVPFQVIKGNQNDAVRPPSPTPVKPPIPDRWAPLFGLLVVLRRPYLSPRVDLGGACRPAAAGGGAVGRWASLRAVVCGSAVAGDSVASANRIAIMTVKARMVASYPKTVRDALVLSHGAARRKGGIMPDSRQDNPLDPPRPRENMPTSVRATIPKIERHMGGLG